MQCIGEIHAFLTPLQRLNNHLRLFDLDVGKAAQFTKRVYHDIALKMIQAAQHPLGFKQYGFRDEYGFFLEQCGRTSGLFEVVIGEQPHQHIGINRVRDAP